MLIKLHLRVLFVAFLAMAALLGLAAGRSATVLAGKPVTAGELQRAKPGNVLRVWPLEGGVAANAKAYRILYRSTGLRGEPIAVSGAVFLPEQSAGKDSRPIVAWAHPTSGIVDRCAPTLLPGMSGSVPGLEEMLKRGWAVAATDYEGLGAPGNHPYLIGASAARSVIDSVRAAREMMRGSASNRFAVWGHSQGGHAALFTAEIAARYAPELQLVGVAAAAPATDLIANFEIESGADTGKDVTAMALVSWSQNYGAPLARVVKSSYRAQVKRVAQSCLRTLGEYVNLIKVDQRLSANFLKVDPTTLEPWRSLMTANTPKTRGVRTPVFIAQGTNDQTVKPGVTRAFVKRLCADGARVTYLELPQVSHVFAGQRAAQAAVSWIADRFNGIKQRRGCSSWPRKDRSPAE